MSISGREQVVAVGVGGFDIETIKLFLDSRNVLPIHAGSDDLYPSQTDLGMSDGYFALIDSATVAFGPLEGLRRILEIRAGKAGSLSGNAKLMGLMKQANGAAIFWGALDSAETGKAIQHLIPEMMKFPQANDLVGQLKGLLITVTASENIQLDFQGETASPADAVVLSQLLEAAMLSKRYESGKDNPDLVKVLDHVRITPSGNLLDLWLDLKDDQMPNLIQHSAIGALK